MLGCSQECYVTGTRDATRYNVEPAGAGNTHVTIINKQGHTWNNEAHHYRHITPDVMKCIGSTTFSGGMLKFDLVFTPMARLRKTVTNNHVLSNLHTRPRRDAAKLSPYVGAILLHVTACFMPTTTI
jgi:hypothetical protein